MFVMGMRRHTQHIMIHQNLSIRVGSRTDTNRRYFQRVRYHSRDVRRHAFQHHRTRAGILQSQRLIQYFPCPDGTPTLGAEPTQDGNGLRGQTHVSHDGDPTLNQLTRRFAALRRSSLEFDTIHPRFFEETVGVLQGVRRGYFVGAKGHIPHQHRSRSRLLRVVLVTSDANAAFDGFTMVYHLVHRDGLRGAVSQLYHGTAIAHEDHIDAGTIHVEGRGVVVGRYHADFLRMTFHRCQGERGYLFSG
mmetsp:Transcript_14124/g.16252  ORF Transcript_14124/g.16252 Transcript_14124/m.16252 type:complete len:247 (-) Transcript_14124:297-1037(-)